MKQIAQKLEAEMAKAVSLIVAASHAAAIDVLDEAFGKARRRTCHEAAGGGPRQPMRRQGVSSPRRTGAEIAQLEKLFLAAVWETPGEVMSVLAARVGVPRNTLQIPVARLKAAGRIKTVGSRQFTRYFPIERGGDDRDNVGE